MGITKINIDISGQCEAGMVGKARAEGASTLRKPLLTGGCVCNVGLPVLSRPSPGSANVRFQAGASITANFRFGSNCDLRHRLALRLECDGDLIIDRANKRSGLI